MEQKGERPPVSNPLTCTASKMQPVGKMGLSVPGLQWLDVRTAHNDLKTYMGDPNPETTIRNTAGCLRTPEWTHNSVFFLSKSPKTQTAKLKMDKSDFIRLKCVFMSTLEILRLSEELAMTVWPCALQVLNCKQQKLTLGSVEGKLGAH